MKYWNASDIAGGGRVPCKIARIQDAVVDVLDENGWPGAEIVRIGRSDVDNGFNRFVVNIELAPGVALPTYRGSHESVLEGWEHKLEDVDVIAKDVAEGLDACRDPLSALGEVPHDLRLRPRKVIAGWQRDGIQAEFVEVRLAQRTCARTARPSPRPASP